MELQKYAALTQEFGGQLYNYASSGGDVTEDYLLRAAVNIFWNTSAAPGMDVNEWLSKVMQFNAVACQMCTATWSEGLGKPRADSADEAMVSAYAHDWQVEKGKIRCPDCKEESNA